MPQRPSHEPRREPLGGAAAHAGGASLHDRHAIVRRLLAAAVKTSTKELDGSRVRVEVEVGSEALERELASAAGEIGRDMKVPGFRQGKVPPQVVLQQVGREAVLDQAVRGALLVW